MTREEIIEMVEEAGPIVRTPFDVWCRRFAALVAAAEREACASILDRNAEVCGTNSAMRDVLAGNALAIRARGEQE